MDRALGLRLARATPALVALSLLVAAPPARGKERGLPRGYRTWVHVKSMAVTDPDHGMYGFHNVYANPAALRVLRAGGAEMRFPEGAEIVVSIYEVETRGGAVNAGAKRRDVVKTKDRTATATGGWRFAAFDPKGRPIAIDPVSDCHACHAGARKSDLVFTRFSP